MTRHQADGGGNDPVGDDNDRGESTGWPFMEIVWRWVG